MSNSHNTLGPNTPDWAEKLSACVDGELNPSDFDGVFACEEARARWSRHHLLRDCLQNEMPAYCDMGLAERVSHTLNAEENLVHLPRPRSWGRMLGGGAIAASVFATLIGSWQWWQAQTISATPLATTTPTLQLATPVNAVAGVPDEDQRQLEELLINHTEAVSANGLQVMLPYARVVSDRIELPIDDNGKNLNETESH